MDQRRVAGSAFTIPFPFRYHAAAVLLAVKAPPRAPAPRFRVETPKVLAVELHSVPLRGPVARGPDGNLVLPGADEKGRRKCPTSLAHRLSRGPVEALRNAAGTPRVGTTWVRRRHDAAEPVLRIVSEVLYHDEIESFGRFAGSRKPPSILEERVDVGIEEEAAHIHTTLAQLWNDA